ncbi:MAG: hypothetical protein KF712_15850 [Akkermansiaceae bacterium]|nr:hypothetical protein [Akkermansiaceae bacterium]
MWNELEKRVKAGESSGIDKAEALHRIYSENGGRLWKSGFHSFDQYCEDRWGYQKAHAYRVVKFGGFIKDLKESHPGLPLPSSESQVRKVLTLPPGRAIDCWVTIATAIKNGTRMTGDAIDSFVQKHRPSDSREQTPMKDTLLKLVRGYEKNWERFKGHPVYERIKPHLEAIENEVQEIPSLKHAQDYALEESIMKNFVDALLRPPVTDEEWNRHIAWLLEGRITLVPSSLDDSVKQYAITERGRVLLATL